MPIWNYQTLGVKLDVFGFQ